MRDLPAGTVTFLFTDIEGSTRLLDELGAHDYASALAEHRGVLRDAFARHGGVELDTQGDALFVAFPTAPGALKAAHEAQRGLNLPVRIGLHTGTPLLTEEATSARTSTAPLASRPPVTAGRCSSRRRRRRSSTASSSATSASIGSRT